MLFFLCFSKLCCMCVLTHFCDAEMYIQLNQILHKTQGGSPSTRFTQPDIVPQSGLLEQQFFPLVVPPKPAQRDLQFSTQPPWSQIKIWDIVLICGTQVLCTSSTTTRCLRSSRLRKTEKQRRAVLFLFFFPSVTSVCLFPVKSSMLFFRTWQR